MRLATVLVLALATTAAADSSLDKARGHFKQGKAFQDAGAYERAADEYKQAYELDPRPEMLFNIAQAYRLAKIKDKALDYFKQYLDKQPAGAGADEARKHVVTLTKEIDEEAAAKEAPPPTVLPPEPAPVERTVLVDRGKTLRVLGIGTAAAGVIAVGVGVKLALDARSAADDITNHTGPWKPGDEAAFDDGQAANRNMKIAYAIGGTLVAGGAVMYFFGWRAQATPVITREAAGVAITGAF